MAICHGWARRCERITIHMCQDIGYNLTIMPNLMGHEDQLQADRGVNLFRDLVIKRVMCVCVWESMYKV
jgi:frizzled protein 9/10